MTGVNGYDLSRSFWDWCFENPDKVKPNHPAMYFFIIEHCNRLGWKEKFGLPMEMTKDAIGISNYRTYSNTFEDLVNWGFIKVFERSKNQYSATVIGIVKNAKANTKALSKATQKHDQKQYIGIVGIDKPYNNKPINIPQPTIEVFLEYCKTIKEIDYAKYEFSLKSKFETWVDNGWKDGNDKAIKNWKSKIKNTIPYLRPNNQISKSGTIPSYSAS